MPTLNELMPVDHVIRVQKGYIFPNPVNIPIPPEVYALSDDNGQHLPGTDDDLKAQAESQGWSLLSGFTGQHGYNGVCMHASEFIGGALADHIKANDGYWVAILVYENDGEPDSWAIAYRPL